jgi:hypothetical protein
MRRSVVLGAGVALLVVLMATPALAVSPIIEAYQEKGRSADAWADACVQNEPEEGDTTCEFANASVFNGRSRFNGERNRDPVACFSLGNSVFDSSAGSEGLWFDTWTNGCTDDGTATVARDLSNASGSGLAQVTIDECIYDPSTDEGSCETSDGGTIAFDVEWTGDGPLSRSSSHSRERSGNCWYAYSSRGRWRSAVATGTIDGHDVEFIDASLRDGAFKYTEACRG